MSLQLPTNVIHLKKLYNSIPQKLQFNIVIFTID